jgi:ferric-dicitrate binding protein FerR (iron transport regulator)
VNEHSHELERLLNALVDADSPETAEECELQLAEILRNDAAARKRYREFMGLHAALMWDYAAAATDRPEKNVVSIEPSRLRWRRALQWAAVLAVAALAVALVFVGSRKLSRREVARVEALEGAVSWSNDTGGQRGGLSSGMRLAAGTLSVEGASSSAQLRFDDGTVLTLTGDAELGFSDDGQKRLALRRGAFTGRVAHQPTGRPMVVRTNTAEIEVLGTVFALASEQNQTALNVESGNVRMRRLADGRAVEVSANRVAVASLDVGAALETRVQSMPPEEWLCSFNEPPPTGSKGQWRPPSAGELGRMGSLPFVAGHSVDGRLIVHHGVAVRAVPGEDSGLVTLTERSMLHVRFRTEQRTGLKLFLSCEGLGGTFGGNFELAIEPSEERPDTDGWMRVDVPMRSMRVLSPEEHPSAEGERVRMLILHSYERDAGLEVAEIGIGQEK